MLVVVPDALGRQVMQAQRFADVSTEHLPGRIMVPGFVHRHIHFPQTEIIGSPAEAITPQASWPPNTWMCGFRRRSLSKYEIAWVREWFLQARSYLSVYEQFDLMRPRAIYAHCIHFDDEDRALMRSMDAAAPVGPTSNLFLDNGVFDYAGAGRQLGRVGVSISMLGDDWLVEKTVIPQAG